MSWWIYLEIDTGNGSTANADDWNLTYNYGPMLRLYPSLAANSLATLHRMNAAAAADVIDGLRHDMERHPQMYREKEPPNGWGDYDLLLEWCHSFIAAGREHPLCKVRVS